MRTFVIAVLVASMTLPAYSQGLSGGKMRKGRGGQQTEQKQKQKADDGAYKSALDKIPNQSQKSDPWRNAR